MSAKTSKCLYQNLFMGVSVQIRAVYKDHKILVTLKRCITWSFKFLDLQYKVSIVYMIVVLSKTFLVYLAAV